jgi:hypothetical protein
MQSLEERKSATSHGPARERPARIEGAEKAEAMLTRYVPMLMLLAALAFLTTLLLLA